MPAAHLVELARDELGEMSTRRRAEGFAKLSARRRPGTVRKRVVRSFAIVLGILGFVLIGHRWRALHPTETLSYAIEGGRIDTTGAIEPTGAAEPTLRFSDGTEVVFLGGARGRVRSVDEHGARIGLTGKVSVGVVHWKGSHWLFDAGPFLITVKGTTFTAEWREAEERLEVVLKSGTVAVSGPLSDEAVTLRAGQRLVISAREKEVLIRDIDSSDIDARIEAIAIDSVKPPTSQPPSSGINLAVPILDAPGSETARAEKPARRSSPMLGSQAPSASSAAPSWRTELAAGRFAIILQQAEQRGLDASLAEVSSEDLAVLADAARYSRRDDVARRALAAQRRRFPQSTRANDAAFLLGRLEETAQHPELALAWYERCLTESPHGTYISEALGRKMTVVQRFYGAARARPIAEEYLRRFGTDTYAAAARALTRGP